MPSDSGLASQERTIVNKVTVRFAGDSGDGMQLIGNLFATEAAWMGNDLATFPDYPAEIRAPIGTLNGVSGFQLQIGASDVYTPGDNPDVLVAMNPAALKVGLKGLKDGGIVLLNTSSLTERNLQKAGLTKEDLDRIKSSYRLYEVEITKLTQLAVNDLGLTPTQAERCKNFFALGLISWMFNRKIEPTIDWIKKKFAKNPAIMEANEKTLVAGYRYGESAEIFSAFPLYDIPRARMNPGLYTNLTGNQAIAYGLVAAAKQAGLELFLGSYPITPASEILHELAKLKHLNVVTFQAEDEIAGICSAIGASFAGMIAATSTSGPGLSLKQEALGLALMLEIPLVVVDVQRGGPSTGLPTKTEQSDLMQALYGRHGEAPVVVLAAKNSADCFHMAYEAVRIATKYMIPVIVLSDSYLANGSEPFRIPSPNELPEIKVQLRTDPNGFYPYLRDPKTLARPWAIPGTPGLEHRIGGLEKDSLTGCVSYDADNHEKMVLTRQEKIARVQQDIPDVEVLGSPDSEVALVGWGSTFGAIAQSVDELNRSGIPVAQVHLSYLNPLPGNLGEVLKRFKKVIVPEINLGQLSRILRATYSIETIPFNRVLGVPIRAQEIVEFVHQVFEGVVA
ncbi:MAG: 2-oxoacid:acceptor oxidoreductase subunit alpha [Nitrospirota bacterium]|nr:2-oxoacid:acceptor oxidoreductase subunit alpha [Nitrospirota bacterium]